MDYPNHAFISAGEGQLSIGNAHIVRTFSLDAEKHLRTVSIQNRRAETELLFGACSEEFVVRLQTGRKKTAAIKASALRVADILTKEADAQKQLEIRFAPLHALGVTYLFSVTYTATDAPYMYKALHIAASDDRVRIDTIDTELISLPREMQQKWSAPVCKKIYLSPFQAALGQPVYLNGMYTGSEFPAADNHIEDGFAHVRYYAGKTLGKLKGENREYVTWNTVFGAARSTEQEIVQADFLEYIRAISRPLYLRTQYNSWFDHMLDIDKDNIRSSFFEIDKGLSGNGVPPLHSYVVDDGWVDYDKDFWCFNEKFPNELYESAALAKSFGSDFGLWLGPRGGYNSKTPKFGKNMQKSGKGGYNRYCRDVCTADHRYHKNVTELFLDYMERFDINYWKLDGFLLRSCPSKKHGHPTGGFEDMYCFTDHWENWIRIFKQMHDFREKQGKSLWLNQTSYCNASPWYLQFCESLWIQNSSDVDFVDKTDSGEAMHGSDADKMLTYRDDRYFDFCRTRANQFPLSNVYNHDPIYGNTAKVQMTDDEFRKYMFMLASRGTAFWELYYSYNLFNDAKWRINADVLRFLSENFSVLQNAKLVGDSPKTGAVYGYSAWKGEKGFVTVRNPLNRPQTFAFTLDRLLGTPESANALSCLTVLPYTEAAESKMYAYGDTVSLTLAPHEVRVLYFGAPDTTEPQLIRAKMIAENTALFTFDKRIAVKENSFTINGTAVQAELLENYSEVCITLPRPLKNGEAVTLSYSITDAWGNCGTAECALTYYENGLLPQECPVTGDFTLRMRMHNAPKDGVLLMRGNLTVTVSNGKLSVDCGGVKAKSEENVSEHRFVRADIVRERNGLIKVYVDGSLSGGGYKNGAMPEIAPSGLRVHDAVAEYAFYNTAMPFDQLK